MRYEIGPTEEIRILIRDVTTRIGNYDPTKPASLRETERSLSTFFDAFGADHAMAELRLEQCRFLSDPFRDAVAQFLYAFYRLNPFFDLEHGLVMRNRAALEDCEIAAQIVLADRSAERGFPKRELVKRVMEELGADAPPRKTIEQWIGNNRVMRPGVHYLPDGNERQYLPVAVTAVLDRYRRKPTP